MLYFSFTKTNCKLQDQAAQQRTYKYGHKNMFTKLSSVHSYRTRSDSEYKKILILIAQLVEHCTSIAEVMGLACEQAPKWGIGRKEK